MHEDGTKPCPMRNEQRNRYTGPTEEKIRGDIISVLVYLKD